MPSDDTSDETGDERTEEGRAEVHKLAEYMAQKRERLEEMRQRSPIVNTIVQIVLRPRYTLDTIASGYIALRIFVLMFPIAYIVVAGIGLYANHSESSAKSISEDNGLTGALASSIATAAEASDRGHFAALVVGTVAALWAARGLLKALRISHTLIWRLPDAKYKTLDVAPFLVILAAFLALWLGSVANRLRDTEGVPAGVAFAFHGAVIAVLWFVTSKYLPRGPCTWPYLVPGAVLVGAGAAGLNIAVVVYFGPKLHRSADTYGALGAGLVLITYLLAVGWMIVLSAELNAGIWEITTGNKPADRPHLLDES
jgi:uncharacterized BrkB/YihY/UPF0761 family membrane protein